MNKERLLVKSKEINSYFEFKNTFMISAKTGEGIEDILNYTNELSNSKGWLLPRRPLYRSTKRHSM